MKTLILIILLILVFILIKFIPTFPLGDVTYSDIKLKDNQTFIDHKPEILFLGREDNFANVNSKALRNPDYYISFVGTTTYIDRKDKNSPELTSLFEFKKIKHFNRPTIYKKDNYIIAIINSFEGNTEKIWNIIVHNEDNKKTYNFDIKLSAEKEIYSLGEFESNPYLYLDIVNDVVYFPVWENNSLDRKNQIISYNLNTGLQEVFIDEQNSKCNTLYFITREGVLYWQESYEKADIGFMPEFKFLNPICKSYKKKII